MEKISTVQTFLGVQTERALELGKADAKMIGLMRER
jgi:hypothetical protein